MLCDNSWTAFSKVGVSYQTSGMAEKQCVLSTQGAGKRLHFSETFAGIATLTQWTPCDTLVVQYPLECQPVWPLASKLVYSTDDCLVCYQLTPFDLKS